MRQAVCPGHPAVAAATRGRLHYHKCDAEGRSRRGGGPICERGYLAGGRDFRVVDDRWEDGAVRCVVAEAWRIVVGTHVSVL